MDQDVAGAQRLRLVMVVRFLVSLGCGGAGRLLGDPQWTPRSMS
jgi:hypothetical protein